jgi:proteasome lid subunit RPN8/RPN11
VISELFLPRRLAAQLESEARGAFPRECCGLIEGHRGSFDIHFLHPVQNLRSEPDKFEIDPAEQLRLMKAARGRDAEIIGCYHSHPNGRPEPSVLDVAGADEDNFLWLIAALTACQSAITIAPFVFTRGK